MMRMSKTYQKQKQEHVLCLHSLVKNCKLCCILSDATSFESDGIRESSLDSHVFIP